MLYHKNETKCPKCDSKNYQKYGLVRGRDQRYKCKLCNGQFTLSKRRKEFYFQKYMAINMYLSGMSYRMIARELRASDVSIRKWIKQILTEEPLLRYRFEQKEKYIVWVSTHDLTKYPKFKSTQAVSHNNNDKNGGIFIESHSKFLRNKVIHVELIPRS